ncbi:MAG: hypothetical protein Q8P62_02510 [Candidatus Peregrinibacteria bacterium]|nr:hypothetical protein [Candidatus Peregrinibacteria bacterium]
MAKKKFYDSEIAEVKALEDRFNFIKNPVLRENVAINMQYIIFLLSIEAEYELPGAVTYSTFKTIIIFTASIVESLIHYKLSELIAEKKIEEDQIMGREKKYSQIKELYKISTTERICGVKEITNAKRLSDDTDFCELNKAAKRCKLFTEEIFQKAEKIRKMRNRIHPYSLKEVDDKYEKRDIDDIFSTTRIIIERIEKYE